MKFKDWFSIREQTSSQEVVNMALNMEDPPNKTDEKAELIPLEEINDNIKMLKKAETMLKGIVDSEKDETKKKFTNAKLLDVRDTLNKWEEFKKFITEPPPKPAPPKEGEDEKEEKPKPAPKPEPVPKPEPKEPREPAPEKAVVKKTTKKEEIE